MEIKKHDIIELIRQGEGLTLEFKECRRNLNKNVYETVCAFLNRHGGTLLLGVSDSGEIKGIDPDHVVQLKKDFVTAGNNLQKINPACYLSVDDIQVEGKTVLRIYVPESSLVHRCNGRIFDRNEDGDFDITDHTRLAGELYHRKQTTYSENKIYPFAGLKDLRTDLIDKCRRLAGVWREDHPWLKMDDMELLQSAQLYQTDPETEKSGVTLAGILLLGNDRLILTVVPHHRTDLILRKVNLDRYDDRDFVDTNLIESYERIMAFVRKHLPDPFFLEGDTRISIRDAIFREVTSNILIHREYRNAFPAKLIIEHGRVRTENSNKPHGFGVLNPTDFTPFPKNPVIGKFFRQIGRADELGSGMRKMMKYGKAYGGEDPQMIEGDVFRIIVTVPEFGTITPEKAISEHVADEAGIKSALSRHQVEILRNCAEEQAIVNLMEVVGRSDRTKFRNQVLRPMLDAGLIEMTIPEKHTSSKQKYRLTAKGRKIKQQLPED